MKPQMKIDIADLGYVEESDAVLLGQHNQVAANDILRDLVAYIKGRPDRDQP